MKLTVTLPTRGRPALLRSALDALQTHTVDKVNTTVVVALDRDDPELERYQGYMEYSPEQVRVIFNHDAREDSLGAKYNRAAAAAPADAYIQHADDQVIETEGWDEKVREALKTFYHDYDTNAVGYEPGLVYFGLGAGTMPANTVVNSAWVAANDGQMFPPHFPQWWHETWLDEVGWLTGRIVWVPEIKCRGIAEGPAGRGKTKSIRDLGFWADFFQRTRPLRLAQAQSILDAGPDPAYRLRQLAQQATQLYPWFAQREAQFADAATQSAIMEQMAESAEPGDAERLDRARASAEAFLKDKGL